MSHLTDWEKLGIEHGSDFKASQRMGPRLKVSSDRLGEAGNRTCDPQFRKLLLVAVFLGYNQYWSGGFMGFCFLCIRTPESSTGSGSDFKASQKTGPWLKVSKGAKIRNRYNQVPHPAQDTKGKVTNSQ